VRTATLVVLLVLHLFACLPDTMHNLFETWLESATVTSADTYRADVDEHAGVGDGAVARSDSGHGNHYGCQSRAVLPEGSTVPVAPVTAEHAITRPARWHRIPVRSTTVPRAPTGREMLIHACEWRV
jgi:hypothetical protein